MSLSSGPSLAKILYAIFADFKLISSLGCFKLVWMICIKCIQFWFVAKLSPSRLALARMKLVLVSTSHPTNPHTTHPYRKSTDRRELSKFPLTPMGVLAHSLRTLDRLHFPPSAWVEIFRCTCLQSHLQTPPPTAQKSYPMFRNPRKTFESTPICPPKYNIVRGWGGPQFHLQTSPPTPQKSYPHNNSVI